MSKRTMNVQLAQFSGYNLVQIGVIGVELAVGAWSTGFRPRHR